MRWPAGDRRFLLRAWNRPFFAMLLVLVLAGCAAGGGAERGTAGPLRVLVAGYAFDEYATLYLVAHPEASIERTLLSLPERTDRLDYLQTLLERYRAALSGDGGPPPDLVVVDPDLYPVLARNGLLRPLDDLLREPEFKPEALAPIVVSGLTVDGHLYGLTPTFAATAIVYNADAFRRAGVEPPSDGMSWTAWRERLAAVVARAGGPLRYGLSLGNGPFSTLYDLAEYRVAQAGGGLFSADGKPTLDLPARREAWADLLRWRRENWLAPSVYEQLSAEGSAPAEPLYAEDDFLTGRAAAMVVTFYDLRRLIDLFSGENVYVGDRWVRPAFSWNVVGFPRPDDGRAVGGPFWPSLILTVNAKSDHPERALDFLRFVLSDRVAEAKRSTDLWELLTRVDANRHPAWEGLHLSAFWSDAPAPLPSPYAPPGVPEETYVQAEGLLREAFSRLSAGPAGPEAVAQALAEVERRLRAWSAPAGR
ncbi:ABC transporter substrate-binding protein [Hydrogenibacillus sp. N12]|uniref:ABC transporter substrate-binding protein n=1 Tax=Hydrogenibacillus sp. N12 TaxID=2866627 RepID=UPI001C7E098F|nr:ABC transporter substrate-binding protein [Hydrogenibacillus sp. N12]QZA32708.1 ABC transporter substrate-binding protein [Hydrogenibacillus sp. N12]